MSQYELRDIISLDKKGGYYFRHVSAMTGEKLHSKSDIAAELGHRDMLIDTYRDLCGELLASLKTLSDLHCPFTGTPTRESLMHFWVDEKAEGRGIADDMIAALNAITKAEAIMGENSNG